MLAPSLLYSRCCCGNHTRTMPSLSHPHGHLCVHAHPSSLRSHHARMPARHTRAVPWSERPAIGAALTAAAVAVWATTPKQRQLLPETGAGPARPLARRFSSVSIPRLASLFPVCNTPLTGWSSFFALPPSPSITPPPPYSLDGTVYHTSAGARISILLYSTLSTSSTSPLINRPHELNNQQQPLHPQPSILDLLVFTRGFLEGTPLLPPSTTTTTL